MNSIQALRDQHRDIVRDMLTTLPMRASGDSKPEWTTAVKETMRELCENQYMQAYPGSFCGTYRDDAIRSREWVLDVVWYLADKEEGIVLGLESEWAWKNTEVRDDYAKLLSVKAPIKILLFEAGTTKPRNTQSQIDSLHEVSRRWLQHSRGDVIYAIDFHDGEHKTYFFEVPRDGGIPEFSFQLVAELSGWDSAEG